MEKEYSQVVRIPVSLKFEKDSFYTDFVEPLRDKKELSSFILLLLKLYYTNPDIQVQFDKYATENFSMQEYDFVKVSNPFSPIKEQIDKVFVAHNKMVIAADAIKDLLKNTESTLHDQKSQWETPRSRGIKTALLSGVGSDVKVEEIKVFEEIEATEKAGTVSYETQQDLGDIEERTKKLEATLPGILTKLDMVLQLVTNPSMSTLINESSGVSGAPISNQHKNELNQSVKTSSSENSLNDMIIRSDDPKKGVLSQNDSNNEPSNNVYDNTVTLTNNEASTPDENVNPSNSDGVTDIFRQGETYKEEISESKGDGKSVSNTSEYSHPGGSNNLFDLFPDLDKSNDEGGVKLPVKPSSFGKMLKSLKK